MSYLNYDLDFDVEDYIACDSYGWFDGNWGGCNNGIGSCCNPGYFYNYGCGCGNIGNTGNNLPAGLCSQTVNNVVIDGSMNSRIINVPVTIQNLVNNRDFIVWVTVYVNTINGPVVVGQDFTTVCNSGLPGCSNYTFEMPIAINVPICNSANISVSVNGNYVCVCGGLTNC